MKIICIGRNYVDHAKELHNPLPSKPIFFMKPNSALLINNNPFFIPSFSNAIHYEAEIVLKVCRLGKSIQKKFAHRYYNQVGVGIDFTARDLQEECKKAGHPWEIAKAFDQSAVINKLVDINSLPDRNGIDFHLEVNGKTVQHGNTKDLIFTFEEIIEYVSAFITLKTGDLIYTGTPAGVGSVKKDDHLVAYLEEQVVLDFHVR